MSSGMRETETTDGKLVAVSFGEKYAASAAFIALYRDGMALVEETAAYLDGHGRQEAKGLKGPLTLAYATESMRLTTRLMQLASWLLIRKAVNDGEMSREDGLSERRKVRFSSIGRPGHTKDFDLLPQRLRSLVECSFVLLDRIQKLDQVISGEPSPARPLPAPAAENTVSNQNQRLRAAFEIHDLAKARAARG